MTRVFNALVAPRCTHDRLFTECAGCLLQELLRVQEQFEQATTRAQSETARANRAREQYLALADRVNDDQKKYRALLVRTYGDAYLRGHVDTQKREYVTLAPSTWDEEFGALVALSLADAGLGARVLDASPAPADKPAAAPAKPTRSRKKVSR